MATIKKEAYSRVCLDQLQTLLDSAVNWGAAFGNVQIYNPSNKLLEIVAQHGFDDIFLNNFSSIETSGSTICAMAFRLGARVCFSDIHKNPKFAPMLSHVGQNSFTAVQSTPILSRAGLVIGILSTHFLEAIAMTHLIEETLDGIAAEMANRIETYIPEVVPSF